MFGVVECIVIVWAYGIFALYNLEIFSAHTSTVHKPREKISHSLSKILYFLYNAGPKTLAKDITDMTGRKLGIYWLICWAFITPAILLVSIILVFTM